MHRTTAVPLFFCALILGAIHSASAESLTIPTVLVGDPGNGPDSTGLGSVGYAYRIGTTEVTNAQYAAFLNAKAKSDPLGLYNPAYTNHPDGGIERSGSSGSYSYALKPNMADKPVGGISWYDAIRFINWLNNGQGNGDTESGAYTLSGPYVILDGNAVPSHAENIVRNGGASWFLPNENEWYKAAYYQPASQGGDADSYWLYPTRSNDAPTLAIADAAGNITNPGANVANYNFAALGLSTVTSAGPLSNSYYGAADQGGNVGEWNETRFSSGSLRGYRGGDWLAGASALQSSGQFFTSAQFSNSTLGFRVAAVPEPSAAVLALVGCGLVGLLRRRLTSRSSATSAQTGP